MWSKNGIGSHDFFFPPVVKAKSNKNCSFSFLCDLTQRS